MHRKTTTVFTIENNNSNKKPKAKNKQKHKIAATTKIIKVKMLHYFFNSDHFFL